MNLYQHHQSHPDDQFVRYRVQKRPQRAGLIQASGQITV